MMPFILKEKEQKNMSDNSPCYYLAFGKLKKQKLKTRVATLMCRGSSYASNRQMQKIMLIKKSNMWPINSYDSIVNTSYVPD